MQIQHQTSQQGGAFIYIQNEQRLAEMTYQWRDAVTIVVDHTWVDETLRGQGVARQLLDHLVAFTREKNLKVVAICSYVEVIFRRDSSLADVVS